MEEHAGVGRVGILGGTFDPPHMGHLVAAEEARAQLALERVLFVPAGTPPHKQGEPVTPATHRLEMVARAIADNPYFFVSLVDIFRTGPSYTVETVRQFREQWGAAVTIYFIMGMDSLHDLPTWHRPQELVRLCRLAVVERPGYTVDLKALDEIIPGVADKVDFVPIPRLEISSTDLRERQRQGRSLRYFVPATVEAYIQAHGLYRGT